MYTAVKVKNDNYLLHSNFLFNIDNGKMYIKKNADQFIVDLRINNCICIFFITIDLPCKHIMKSFYQRILRSGNNNNVIYI